MFIDAIDSKPPTQQLEIDATNTCCRNASRWKKRHYPAGAVVIFFERFFSSSSSSSKVQRSYAITLRREKGRKLERKLSECLLLLLFFDAAHIQLWGSDSHLRLGFPRCTQIGALLLNAISLAKKNIGNSENTP